jgi:hypothetical protein
MCFLLLKKPVVNVRGARLAAALFLTTIPIIGSKGLQGSPLCMVKTAVKFTWLPG